MPRRSREIQRALSAKGFATVETHHTQMYLVVDGQQTGIHTFLSRGMEYGDALLARMAREQLRLSRRDLDRLLDCPMSHDEYVRTLRASGRLPVG